MDDEATEDEENEFGSVGDVMEKKDEEREDEVENGEAAENEENEFESVADAMAGNVAVVSGEAREINDAKVNAAGEEGERNR